MNKLKIILTASIAAVLTLTLSCSNGGDEESSGNSGPNTKVYTLKNKTATQFTYVEVYTDYECREGGVLKTEEDTDEETINYSIKNNIMTWQNRWSHSDDDTLHLKGTSNELTGTWTRTKNKAASCKLQTESYCNDWDYDDDVCVSYEEEIYYSCKEDYDITEAVFTDKTVKITRDVCGTDYMQVGEDWRGGDAGWKRRPINCDTYEVYKGSEKVTVKENRNSIEVSYNGKSCKMSEYSKSQRESACKEAWKKHQGEDDWDDYYYDILRETRKSFYDCLQNSMPKGFYNDDDDEDNGSEEVVAKPASAKIFKAKTFKLKPLLKKKK